MGKLSTKAQKKLSKRIHKLKTKKYAETHRSGNGFEIYNITVDNEGRVSYTARQKSNG